MDGGAGEEGKQERHLVLAHKLFLLSHPAVDDLSKVALRAEVLDTVKSDDMATLFESLVAAGVLQLVNKMNLNHSLVAKFRKKSTYIHQMISTPKGDAKELRKARRRRHPKNGVWKMQAISGS